MPDVVDEIAAVVEPEAPMTDGEKAAVRRLLAEADADPMPPELAQRIWKFWNGGDAR